MQQADRLLATDYWLLSTGYCLLNPLLPYAEFAEDCLQQVLAGRLSGDVS